MSREAALNMLNKLDEDGWESIEPFFGSFNNFYLFLKKNGVDDEITYKSIPDELTNRFGLILMKTQPEKMLNDIITNILTDVYKKNDEYYLKLRDREEVAEFFKDDNRDFSPRKAVERVMGEDWWEPYDYTTDDVYRDVIEELNPEKLKYLKERVLSDLKDVEIEINNQSSEEMKLIASEQGHDDHLFVTPENIDRIVDDEETMNYLLDNELSDVKSDLYHIHSTAYNSAYTDELWEDIMNELSTHFEPKFHTETIKVGDKTRYEEYLKINDFPGIILDFFSEYENSEFNDDLLEYHGNFTGILTKMMDEAQGYDWLNFRIPDYPNSRKVDEYINDLLTDYI